MLNGKQSKEAEAEAEAANQSQVEAVKSLCVCSHLVGGGSSISITIRKVDQLTRIVVVDIAFEYTL